MVSILITGFPTMGGSGLVATKLGLQLAKFGFNVHFLFYKEPFFLKKEDFADNITFHKIEQPSYALFQDIGAPYTIQSASKMISIVKNYNIDIIHSHYLIPHAVSAYLAKNKVDVKIVNTSHGSDTHTLGKDESYNPIVSLALQNSNSVTSVSKFLAKETEEIFDLQKNSVDVVYNFIEPNVFLPYNGQKENSIIQASNFRPIKQLPFMIEVFSELSFDFPDWDLKLVGYGPEYPICVRKSRELGIRDKVKFLGVRRDVPNLIAKSGILASTSRIESFGLTIAEAMSSETSVWAPNTGGIPEICIDKENGLLFELDNREHAISTLRELMESQNKREEYGKKGRERVLKEFSPEVIVKNYVSVYDRILE